MSGRFLLSYRAPKSLSAGKIGRSHQPTEAACGEYRYIYDAFAKFMPKSTPDKVAVAGTPGACGGTIKGIDKWLSQKSNLSLINPQNPPIFTRIDPRRATSGRLLLGKTSLMAPAGKRRRPRNDTMGLIESTVEDVRVPRRSS